MADDRGEKERSNVVGDSVTYIDACGHDTSHVKATAFSRTPRFQLSFVETSHSWPQSRSVFPWAISREFAVLWCWMGLLSLDFPDHYVIFIFGMALGWGEPHLWLTTQPAPHLDFARQREEARNVAGGNSLEHDNFTS